MAQRAKRQVNSRHDKADAPLASCGPDSSLDQAPLEYADGNRYHLIGLCFAVAGDALQLSDETTEYGYFTQTQIATMDLLETHRERITDAFAGRAETTIQSSTPA